MLRGENCVISSINTIETHNTMKLYRLTLQTLLMRKAWVVALFCVAVLPFLLPILIPAEFALGLVEPARAQAAWPRHFLAYLIAGSSGCCDFTSSSAVVVPGKPSVITSTQRTVEI